MKMRMNLGAKALMAAVCMLVAHTAVAEIDPGTIVGAWLFEKGGNTVADASGNRNDGTIEGDLKIVAGQFGNGLEFGGDADYVVIKDDDTLDLNEMTVAAWIFLKTYADDVRIISKEEGVNDPYSVYSLQISGTGDSKLEFRPTLAGARQRIETIADVPLDEWTHVAATYDGSEVVMYINGEVDVAVAASGEMMVNDKDLWIGGSEFWEPRWFEGTMDDAVLLSVALPEDDIMTLVDVGLPVILAVSPKGRLAAAWGDFKR
jgi:hypothetical protein